MRLLFAASEVFPYAKTGGLADVADALPKALAKEIDISRVMPLYGFMQKEAFSFYDNFTLSLGEQNYSVKVYKDTNEGVITYFIEAPYLSDTQSLYGDVDGDYENNALRFGLFCKAVVMLGLRLNITHLHLNDWHSALVALFVKELSLKIKTLFTIHNLAYQGIFEKSTLQLLGIDAHCFTMEGVEFYNQVNFLKAGIAYADAITTVSPSYAKEILTPEFGCGLDGFLRLHEEKLFGILNGIDEDFFNPKSDANIIAKYDADSLELKTKNKDLLTQKLKIRNAKLPLFVMISRLVEQKGVTLLIKSLPLLQKQKINIFLLGDGDSSICKTFENLALKYDNFYFIAGYDEALSHKSYAAADFLLMPSRFEPCGLNQFIAMRYATLPLVHAVGGLKDSVHETAALCGRGFVYEEQKSAAFIAAVQRALRCYKDKNALRKLQQFNMQCDFSFDKSALQYIKLYKELL